MVDTQTLPSWNDGAVKATILDFVARITKQGSADFVPPAERISTFDMDGTLWCERPLQVQVFFLFDRVKELSVEDPALVERLPFKAVLEHDYNTLFGLGKQAVFELVFATHAGMTDEDFDRVSLMKLPELNSFDDREAKPLNISLHIGRRPLLAFGNSDGDLPMLRYAKSGPGARLALLLRHDDAEREVAYDREFRLSPLVEALDKAGEYGIAVVSMKRDWKFVF